MASGVRTGGEFAREYQAQVVRALGSVDLEAVGRAIEILREARAGKRHVFVCGNGGSAATASHFVTDMVKGASYRREERFRIMALTDSMPTITAYSNDVGYGCVFAEQLKNFAEPGDVFIGISGSGNSPNVVCAMEYAGGMGCETIALTGRGGGKLGPLAKVEIRVGDEHMGRIEDAHLMVCHMLCYYFMES